MNELTIPTQLANRDSDRIRGYKELLDFYHGEQWEGRATRGEKRLTFNYTRVFIDKVTSYLMSGIHFAVDPLEDSEGARAKAQRGSDYSSLHLRQKSLGREYHCYPGEDHTDKDDKQYPGKSRKLRL